MGLQRMKIATKLWAFILLVIGAICAVAVVGLIRSASILGEGRATQANAVDLVQIATEWNGLTMTNAARNQAILLSQGPAVAEAFKEPVNATSAQIGELQKKIEAMPLSDADKAQMQKIGELRKSVIALRDKARELKAAGSEPEALQIMESQYLPTMGNYIAAQKEMVEMQKRRVAEVAAETERRRSANSVGILVGLAVIVAAIFAGTAWLVRSIREPLVQANELAARIAQGDLSSVINTNRQDEFGSLLVSLRSMNESLARMVSQVRSSTDSIAIASAEIAMGNNDLAQRTEQTSSNLQATASSMDGLTTTVQHSTDNARQASALAASASSVAQRGGEVVTQVVSTMQEIDASSKKIADIISVIDGIAFQTNILALNAAVEAARAGEQGRGFAVVASEVRSLAGRSAEAAKEIKGLIGTSVDKVESGTKLVTDAGATMQEIVQSVRRVADVIGEITAAAQEQSAGIAGVNQAIGTLDQMTQQNAALVEQSAAAAESLRDQAERMKQAVAVFKVGAVADSGQVLAVAPVRSNQPKATPFKGPERRSGQDNGPAARATAAPSARKPAAAAPKPTVHASTRVTPAGGDEDWETF
ncbi:methyl-accepting chemotaxis protein [Rhodoferax saidenbachensis]|uniref:Methyl-accepting chemotaxis protein n=1 Tax=Rhodoferax saidenbachensis TaxID=1484693 RepID=A0ABU1ZLS9_9BURK|nr:methyl-accepting chemotaxis protein [Rhodoferax saidenbachensis]MDR7306497.1 methyl-accepting chemotaxis protein [Rhodoferax saidenbachensis]